MAAKELSIKVKPILDKHNIRFIGIGFDASFVKPFIKEGYFLGELYIDSDKQCYNALNYKRFSYFELLKCMVSLKWIEAYNKILRMGISGDMRGDGFQNGGALVVGKSGKILFEYRQEDAADHISEEDIFKALDIKI